jgi:hypothetical protein
MPLLKSTETEIVYGREPGERLAAGLVGTFMLGISIIPPIMFVSTISRPQGHSPLDLVQPVAGGLFIMMMGMMIFLFFLVTEDLILDLQTRTYRYRSGLPLLARWKTGPFTDIADVVLRKVTTKQGVAYRVALTWHETPPGFWRAVLRDMRDFVLDNSAPKPLEAATEEMNTLVRGLALPNITGHNADENPEQIRRRSLRTTIFLTLLSALLLGLFRVPPTLLDWQYNTQGRTLKGIITSNRPAKGGTYIAFSYQVNGQTLYNHTVVSPHANETLNVGDLVDVTYLPDYPNTSCANYSPESLTSTVEGLGVVCIIGLPISLYFLYRFRPQS